MQRATVDDSNCDFSGFVSMSLRAGRSVPVGVTTSWSEDLGDSDGMALVLFGFLVRSWICEIGASVGS